MSAANWLFIVTVITAATSEAGKRWRASRVEHVRNAMPAFRDTSQNVSVGPGDRAVLKCRVDHLGTRTITWRKENEVHPLTIGLFPFVADPRIGVDYNQRTHEWSLIIQDVRPTDQGLYHCQINTKTVELESSYDVMLNVKGSFVVPQRIISGIHVTGTEYVERGSAIQLVCNATGRPEPPHNVDWYKDGEKINSDAESGIIITKKIEPRMLISMLVIRLSQMSDAGVYVCRSSYRDAAMINVIVLNVPSTVEKRGTLAERIRSVGDAEAKNDARAQSVPAAILSCLIATVVCLRHLQRTLTTDIR